MLGTVFALATKYMRVAIPTFGADISPRFCFAREMLVFEWSDGSEAVRKRVALGDLSWSERLALLNAHHVDVLLCGGFPRQFLPVAESAGIRVIVGLVGTVEDVVNAFRNGTVDALRVLPCVGRAQETSPGHGAKRSSGRKATRKRIMNDVQFIAVAVETDGGLDASVSEHFGHCAGFVVVEVAQGQIKGERMVLNPFSQAHQPGQLPKVVQGLGASVLLAGGMGPRAQAMLAGFGVEVATGATGTARDAVQAFLRGELRGFIPCADHGHNEACGGHHH